VEIVMGASAQEPPRFQDVPFVARVDGTTQYYVRMLPPGFQPQRPHDLLIGLHGATFDRWQVVKDPRDECRALRDVAARHEMILISPDYRAPMSWMSPPAEADVLQILDDLRKQYRVGKVFISGGSMGGSSCLSFAAIHPDLVAGVASMNGIANLFEYKNLEAGLIAAYGGTKAQIPRVYKERSAEYWPERLTMPVAFAAGGQDQAIPPHSVRRLCNVLALMNRPVLMIYRPEGGHATHYEDATAILEFVIAKAKESPAASPAPAAGGPGTGR
jgi:pimeloyl-ACP methyl ester carboxylesterase